MSYRIQVIEEYVKSLPLGEIGHDFKHVDRVRRWALVIAHQEQYADLDSVEAAALLHDIGLVHGGRNQHGQVGAEMAECFLREKELFEEREIAEIANAIRFHSSLDGKGQLLEVLRDADRLDALGAVGLMRAFTSQAAKPEYLPSLIKGETWGMRAAQFTERFRSGVGIGPCIVDQINFQISLYEHLHTQAAKELAEPLHEFMVTFMKELEKEIGATDENRRIQES